MTANTTNVGLASRLVNTVLSISPLANFAKSKARKMMIDRAEDLGVSWRDNVSKLSQRNWKAEFNAIENKQLQYPEYYLNSFHAYESGNLSWLAAWEVESAAYAVHAKIWEDAGTKGDSRLRESYHKVLRKQIASVPQDIADLGCGVGMSTLTLQEIYPEANLTGVDLSPYFLAVAQYRAHKLAKKANWLHRAGEATGLPNNCCDLVSACLVFHELPTTAAKAIIEEANRILRPGGHLAIMDMNPQSETFQKMPPYILTLLKSTEPYLDQYFALDVNQTFTEAGFELPTITVNSPRHRTIIAKIQ
ncbi:Methyltransferase type 11 [Hyella patelloides LEGE 07179]|uniref:Methyltransferase type 11 n=1 Tax=Hyella patelloides LEGE 07179 TaxID=945734 RepID=A0A563VPJ3_9CYAN|nr:class I SAM-dependent methyltransferase [Hyella patelloides]VEP13275.1 Methyltransferase type 11 [Hyella patelloides LEGE 07179]